LSEKGNASSNSVEFGKALVLKKGGKATVIAVGPLLDDVISACADSDVTILYYTSLEPFDMQALMQNCASLKILLCEPYYSGALDYDIIKSVGLQSVKIEHVGVPHLFLTKYGSAQEHNYNIGLTPKNIRLKLESLINA
jgi:transketolase